MNAIKVILVDDNIPFRNAVKALLINQYNAKIIGEASNFEEFWKIDRYFLADIIFMDVMMPGTNGISLAYEILKNHRILKIIAVTMHNEKIYLTTLVEAGFMGCIFKNNIFNELSQAIKEVTNGNLFFPSNILLDEKDAAK